MYLDAVIKGLIWSALWIIYVYVIVTKYPWQMLHEYPKDIQKASVLPEPTTEKKKNAKLFGAIGSLVIFGALITFGLIRFAGSKESYGKVLLYIFIIAMIWNIADLLIMDWLIICRITPKWVVIPGTEGCSGYKDYFFHFKGFLIGCVYTAIMSLLISGVCYLALNCLIWK